MTDRASQIVFSLQDLLTQSPTVSNFSRQLSPSTSRTSVSQNRSSSYYGDSDDNLLRTSTLSSFSSSYSSSSSSGSTGAIIHTKVTVPKNHGYHETAKPLKFPKKPKFLAKSKLKHIESQDSLESIINEESNDSRELSFKQPNATPTAPLTPPPFIKPYAFSNSNRPEKNLRGIKCCFCEESLEYTLAGEKVISLKCGHTTHYECLSHMVDIDSTLEKEIDGFPQCPTCDCKAVPVNQAICHELIKQKLLLDAGQTTPQSNTAYDSSVGDSNSPSFTPMTHSSSSTAKVWWSSPSTPGSLKKTAARSASLSPLAKKKSHKHKKSADQASCVSVGIEEKVRTNTIPMPAVSIIPEVDEVTLSDASERYASYLVNVSVPSDIYSTRHKPTEEELQARQAISDKLRQSISDWRKLDFSLFGRLRLHGSLYMSRDMSTWQEVSCYLFETMLLCVRDYSFDLRGAKLGKSAYVKASVNLSRDLISAVVESKTVLSLNIGDKSVPALYLSSQDSHQLQVWHSGLIDSKLHFPINSGDAHSPLLSPVSPTVSVPVARTPVDVVLAVPSSGVPKETKWIQIRQAVKKLLGQMGQLDRLGIVLYGGSKSQIVPLHRSNWDGWSKIGDMLRPFSISSGAGDLDIDFMEGLSHAVKLLDGRDNKSPVTSIYMLSDHSNGNLHGLADPQLYEMVVNECAESGLAIHTFGITMNHSPDILARTSVTTNGTYFYVREWEALGECVIGRFMADQSFTHSNVQVKLNTFEHVQVVSVNGFDNTINTDVLEGYDGRPPGYSKARSFQPSNLTNISLGSLTAGQTRSFLVQVSIPPRRIVGGTRQSRDYLPLFNVQLSYGAFRNPSERIEKQAGNAMIRLNMDITNSIPEPPPTPISLMTGDVPPSPICGNIVYANEPMFSVPMFLAVQKHNTHVVRRRLQLAAARNLESAIQAMSNCNTDRAIEILAESRPIMKGLLEISATNEKKDNDILYYETKAMAETLDRDVGIIMDKLTKPVLFEQDGRKWVIQTISVLRSQMAFTSRSSIENLFFQVQQEVNVL